MKTRHIKITIEGVLAVLTFGLSAVLTWHIFTVNMLKALVDENSHLNLARQMFDSITPGLSQIGFWPPLLHILMAPAAYFDQLYYSGLAGYVILAPALVLGAIYLYRICFMISNNQNVSVWGVLLYISSPFILYYTAAPMMEVLFLACLFGAAYYMLLWMHDRTLRSLIMTGLMVSFATMARFEGIFLIPVSIIIVLIQQMHSGKKYSEIEAVGLIFGIVSVLGLGFLLGYGYIYGENLFAFSSSRWSAFNQQRDYLLPTQGSWYTSLRYLLHASYHVLGYPIVMSSIILSVVLILFIVFGEVGRKKYGGRLGVIGALAMVGSPFLFDIVALVRGNAIIYVPELFPYGVYFNERYGLYWVGFVIAVLVCVVAAFNNQARTIGYGYIFNKFFLSCFMSFLLIWNFGWLYSQAYVENYRVVKDSAQGYPSHDQAEVSTYLQKHYHGGKILMTRALHDFIAVEAHVPLKNYVQESNYKYFDQVLERPWLFAQYVVMYNPGSSINGNWAKFNEKISARYGNSDEFRKYYRLVVENERERLYVLKPEEVITYASKHDYSILAIPSLQESTGDWNPDTIYTQMKASRFQMNEVDPSLVTPELLISSQFLSYYQKELQPLYKNGWYADDEGGNSTYQSYALLQAYYAHDAETFHTVWNFTRTHLQHTNDNLFASAFDINTVSHEVTITNSESKTGADTELAYALFRAGQVFKNPTYTREASLIISDIWDKRVIKVGGKLVVLSGKTAIKDTVNLQVSSFVPYAYREFAKHDDKHNWLKLANDTIEMTQRISGWETHKNTNVFLPVQEAVLTISDNKLDLPKTNYYGYNFAGDSFEVFYRIGLDAVINNSKSAKNFMYVVGFFDDEWKKKRVCTIVTFKEKTYACSSDIKSYSAPLSVFMVKNRKQADEFVSRYLIEDGKLLDSSSLNFSQRSWYWFGLLIWSGQYN